MSRLLLPLSLMVLLVVTARARADEAADRKASETRLRSRVSTWWTARTKVVKVCPQCQGVGQVRWGRRIVQCPKCDGRKRVVDPVSFRTCFYDLRAPSWRLRPTAQEEVTREFRTAQAGRFPTDVARFKVERVELLEEDRARAYVVVDKDSVARPQEWIREEGEWFFAGDVGGSPAGPAPTGPAKVETTPFDLVSTAVPSLGESADVTAALAGVNIPWVIAETGANGDTLILTLDPARGTSGAVARNAVPASAVSAVRAIFAAPSRWKAVLLHWRTPFRDGLGQVETLPYFSSHLDREKFGKVVWANLSDEERPQILSWRQHTHDGWKPWD